MTLANRSTMEAALNDAKDIASALLRNQTNVREALDQAGYPSAWMDVLQTKAKRIRSSLAACTTPEYDQALAQRDDRWIPACGGSEQPFTCKGRRLLYCFNPAQGRHAYIDLDRDVELTNDEAREILS